MEPDWSDDVSKRFRRDEAQRQMANREKNVNRDRSEDGSAVFTQADIVWLRAILFIVRGCARWTLNGLKAIALGAIAGLGTWIMKNLPSIKWPFDP